MVLYSGQKMTRCGNVIRRGPRRLARAAVRLYRLVLSPLIGFHCRHLPTCSHYADEALDRFGLWAGGWMTLARLPPGARWYAPWRYGRWRGVNRVPASPPPRPPPRVPV